MCTPKWNIKSCVPPEICDENDGELQPLADPGRLLAEEGEFLCRLTLAEPDGAESEKFGTF